MKNRDESRYQSRPVARNTITVTRSNREGVRKIRGVHYGSSGVPIYRGETRKGMNADGTGKVFDGLWDRGHVEGRLYNFP